LNRDYQTIDELNQYEAEGINDKENDIKLTVE